MQLEEGFPRKNAKKKELVASGADDLNWKRILMSPRRRRNRGIVICCQWTRLLILIFDQEPFSCWEQEVAIDRQKNRKGSRVGLLRYCASALLWWSHESSRAVRWSAPPLRRRGLVELTSRRDDATHGNIQPLSMAVYNSSSSASLSFYCRVRSRFLYLFTRHY